jgi:indolepyruvate ferredoxin oxidoreductase beta subunit
MSDPRLASGRTINLYLAGVGGQGLVLVNRLLAEAAVLAGLDAKSTDTHGLAMRGGAVIGTLRIGERVATSIFPPGAGDILVGLEPLEALHGAPMIRAGGTAVVSVDELWPASVCLERHPYPRDWREVLGRAGIAVRAVAGAALAARAGDPRMVNVVMAGAVSDLLPIGEEAFAEAIRRTVPPGTFDKNLAAFRLGREAAG